MFAVVFATVFAPRLLVAEVYVDESSTQLVIHNSNVVLINVEMLKPGLSELIFKFSQFLSDSVDYELACQYLLWRLYTELKGMTFETPKELSTFIDANPRTREIIDTVGPTGAMFSAVVSHLHRLLKKGYNGWVYDIPPDRLTMISKKILKMFDEHYL